MSCSPGQQLHILRQTRARAVTWLGFGEEAEPSTVRAYVSGDRMTQQDNANGYTRVPAFSHLIRSKCDYCGVILVSAEAKLEELEREHRFVCRRARSNSGR